MYVTSLVCDCHIACGELLIGLVPLLALKSKTKIGRVSKWIANWPKLGMTHKHNMHFLDRVINCMAQALHVATK